MAERYVRMNILSSGADKAKATLDDLTMRVHKLQAEPAELKFTANDTQATRTIKDLQLKIAILNRERAEVAIETKGDEKTKATLLDVQSKLLKLDKTVARPDIDMAGIKSAEAQLIRLKLLMDDIHNKRIDVNVASNVDNSFMRRLEMKLTRSLYNTGSNSRGGAGGIGGSGNDETAIEGLFRNGPGGALAAGGPGLYGPIIGLLAALLPSLGGFGVGALAGIGGAAGAIYKSKGLQSSGQSILQQLLGTTGVLTGHPEQYSKSPTQSFSTPTSGPTGLYAIFVNIDKIVGKLTPEIQTMFKASMPFLNAFVQVLGQASKALLPAFTQAMNQMVKTGALKQMTQAFILLVTDGLVPFLKVLGPGMKASAVVFKATILALDGVLVGIGAIATVMAREFALLGHATEDTGKVFYSIGRVIAALLTGNWAALHNAVKAMGNAFKDFFLTLANMTDAGFVRLNKFAHDVSTIFDTIRHNVAAIWDETWDHVKSVFAAFTNWNQTEAASIRHFLANTFDGIRHDIASIWSNTWHYVENQLKGSADDDMAILKNWWHGIEGGFDSLRHSVASTWDQMWGDVKSLARGAISGLHSILMGLESAFETPVRFVINDVWDKLANIWNKVAGIVHVGFKLPVATFATGGVVPGSGTGDTVPALLTPGERVLSTSQVAMAGGHAALDSMFGRGTGGPFAFAGGGVVGGIGSFFSSLGKDLMSWIFKPISFIESHVFGSITSMLGDLGNSGLGQVLKTLVVDIIKALSGTLHNNYGAIPGYGGPASAGLATVARYLMAHGASKAAAAGIAGTVAGESGGNPESVGSGGAGLIGWTPPSSAYPITPLVTGNPGRDMGVQLVDMLAYIQRNGGLGRLNALKNPMSVAWMFSADYERPLVTGSDIRSATVASLYARGLANGGWINEPVVGTGMRSGMTYTLGENGPEYVSPANRMRGMGGGDVYNFTVNGFVGSEDQLATRIQQMLRVKKRHNGGQPLGLD